MTSIPLLSDIEPSKTKFEPGDRLLVRVYCSLTADQRHNLEKSIRQYTGEDVNILIFPAHFCTMKAITGGELLELVEREPQIVPTLGTVHLKCSTVVFPAFTQLIIQIYREVEELQKQQFQKIFERWAGDEVEVVLMTGCK